MNYRNAVCTGAQRCKENPKSALYRDERVVSTFVRSSNGEDLSSVGAKVFVDLNYRPLYVQECVPQFYLIFQRRFCIPPEKGDEAFARIFVPDDLKNTG